MTAEMLWTGLGRAADLLSVVSMREGVVGCAVLLFILIGYLRKRNWSSRKILLYASFTVALAGTAAWAWIHPRPWPGPKHTRIPDVVNTEESRKVQIGNTRAEDLPPKASRPYSPPRDRQFINLDAKPASVEIGNFLRQQIAYKAQWHLNRSVEQGFKVIQINGEQAALGIGVSMISSKIMAELLIHRGDLVSRIQAAIPIETGTKWTTSPIDLLNFIGAVVIVSSQIQLTEHYVYASQEYSRNTSYGRVATEPVWLRFQLPDDFKPDAARPRLALSSQASVTVFENYYGEPIGVEQK